MSRLPAPATDFGRLLRAEWTKLRTVPGWVATVAGALLAVLAVGLLGTAADNPNPARTDLPVGPGGQAVNDSFSFVHRELAGDGTLTVPVLGLTSVKADGPEGSSPGPVAEWAKAGIIVKAGLDQGSSYAAVAATGGHGVRMQDDYVHDTAGRPGLPTADHPHWLRLTRTGDTVTGYDSADGTHWQRIGTAHLPGLPRTAQVGLFTTSPELAEDTGTGTGFTPAVATGRFGPPVLSDGWAAQEHGGDGWTGGRVGPDAGTSGSYLPGLDAGHTRETTGSTGTAAATSSTAAADGSAATGYTVTGAGDIAAVVGGPAFAGGRTIENSLVGTFAGLIALTVVATGSATAEYRRGLIALTLAAAPRRGLVPLAKALPLAALALLTGTAAAALAVPLGTAWSKAHGFPVAAVPDAVRLRVVLGTGLLLALAAVLALALGLLLRRAAQAITAAVTALVLPYLLATSGALPAGASEWLLRVTPAAGFAIQQSLPRLPQVATLYTPDAGYYPLPPWAGLAVLAAWAAAALAAAVLVLRRRDV
ncbi:hypothetical protein [Kitasatospora sp. NPDC057198]|uniref:hypothetical protein n=1 Tax=Kitasatospora sp. NPDC057198 TaxID=3346046 RepID=UPI0036260C85